MFVLLSWWDRWFSRFLSWRVRHISERSFIVFLSLLVGIITGLAGVFLKNSVHFTHQFFTERLQIDSGSLLFFVYPFIGILLTSLFVRYFVREDISHGVTKVLYAILRQNSIIKPHNNYSSMVASTITIGFGGSVGTEATIVLTGGVHRFEPCPFLPHELQGDGVDDRMRDGGGDCGHIQGADCGHCLYDGGADA